MPPRSANVEGPRVHVEPDGLTWCLERTNVSAAQLRAEWWFVPPAGSYFLYAHVGNVPSTGTLTSVRVTQTARPDNVQQIEVAYSTPDTGATSVVIGAVPVYFDGKSELRIAANTATGSIYAQGTVTLIPASTPANTKITGRGSPS